MKRLERISKEMNREVRRLNYLIVKSDLCKTLEATKSRLQATHRRLLKEYLAILAKSK